MYKTFLSCESDACYSELMFPGISFGAACPLSSVEKTLQDAVAELPVHKTEVFRGVLEQMRWFAGKQVKSVAVSPHPQGPGAQAFLPKGGGWPGLFCRPRGPQTLVLRTACGCSLKCRFLGPALRNSGSKIGVVGALQVLLMKVVCRPLQETLAL